MGLSNVFYLRIKLKQFNLIKMLSQFCNDMNEFPYTILIRLEKEG